MPVKKKIPYENGHFFITFTCYNWLHLIALTNSYDLVYNWFQHLTKAGHLVTGYVIMPNHLHATIAFRQSNKSINKLVGDGKRFMAYELIKRLKEQDQSELLKQLSGAVNKSDKARNKKHEVWEDSFDWKECISNAFTEQKLNYMHANPCTGKYMLADLPENYLHSSAKYYLTGEHGLFTVFDYMKLQDIDLTKLEDYSM